MTGGERPRVALLQTSLLFVSPDSIVKSLFRELGPDVELIDLVDGDLLGSVKRDGGVTAGTIRRVCRLVESAIDAGADLVFSACSSVGPAVDVARRLTPLPVVKIDDAMAREAVEMGGAIGVIATVSTTLAPTCDLIGSAAAKAGRQVALRSVLCEGAFAALAAGDRARHDREIEAAALEIAADAGVLVLAQASMSEIGPRIQASTGRRVLTSPRSGVAEAVRLLATSRAVAA